MANEPSLIRVLLLEDEAFIRNTIRRMLRNFRNLDVLEGCDGTEGLRLLDETGPFDLMLCDVQMAPMDGLTFVRTVRGIADPLRSAIPAVMLTAASDMETVRSVSSLGACGYLLKPISYKALADRMAQALRNGPTPAKQLAGKL